VEAPSGFIGQPVTFEGSDGVQYVAILSGVGGWPGVVAQRAMLISAIGFSWLTYFYFPIVYDLTKDRPGLAQMPFQAVVVATTALRLLMMGLAIKHSGKKLQ
jgi:hypothetical protein